MNLYKKKYVDYPQNTTNSMNLYHKYRPDELDKVYGNKEVVESLKKSVKDKKIPQVILFSGPTGTGKTTTARILAKELNAVDTLTEMDSAQFTGVDVIRDIRSKSRFIPIGGGVKVFIMDEVHQLTSAAQEAFLKELEDTPKHVYYFLCTTNPEKLKPTLVGRCIHYTLQTLSKDDMTSLLEHVVKSEDEKLDKEVYKVIVKSSKGHPRNALNLLQQVLSVPNKKRLKIAENYETEESTSIALCRSLLNQEGWNTAQEILKGLKDQNAETIRRHVIGYCQSVLLGKDYKGSHNKAATILEEFSTPTYDMGFAQIVLSCFAYYHSD
jgi:DNA polymerase III gamma/tau subunit